MPTQTELIGSHPVSPDIFFKWLQCQDIKVTRSKCHRSLTELLKSKDKALNTWLAERLIHHHYDAPRIAKLKARYTALGYPKYAAQHRKLPIADSTKKGNATEIILIEYIEACHKKAFLKAYKLRYNPNVDQSMKGDDVLMVDIIKDKHGADDLKVILGESKFRKTPAKPVVDEICISLSKDKLPLSYSYLVDELGKDPSTKKQADLLDEFIIKEIKARGGLLYAGLLMSSSDTSKVVEANLNSKNPLMVFISIGIDDPEDLILQSFSQAEKMILKPTTI